MERLIFTDHETNEVLFDGTREQLAQLLKDVKQIADYIQTDIEANNIKNNNKFAFDTYKEFADKYNN